MTTFLLIRHAETGIEEKAQMREDPLSEIGVSQAGRLAKCLKDLPMKCIYSSPYWRALQTANCIIDVYPSPITIVEDERLRELALWLDPPDLHDDTSEQYKQGVVVLHEAWERVGELLGELREKHQGETITLVCHGNLIRAILGYALKMNLETVVRLKVDLASLSILEWIDESYFRLALFNDTCHLKN